MEHIITTLSLLSLSNSSSYSFQPKTALSISTSWIGEVCKPMVRSLSKSLASCTKAAPDPPKVKDGLITRGNPSSCASSFPFKKELATLDGATGILISFIKALNDSLFSVTSIASISTPIILTL